MAEDGSDDEYTVPLAYPAPYGAGLKKKGIKFVSAGTLASSNDTQAQSGDDIANSYLALVLDKPPPALVAAKESQDEEIQQKEAVAKCQTCNLPLKDAVGVEHHTSLAHQVSLAHIYPPNAIDRTRRGFAYLKEQGWDPDSRQGLGSQGEGILRPVQAKEKKDKAGIGDRSRSTTPRQGHGGESAKGATGSGSESTEEAGTAAQQEGKAAT